MQIVELMPVRPEDVQLAQVREFQLAEIAKVFAIPARAIARETRSLGRAKGF